MRGWRDSDVFLYRHGGRIEPRHVMPYLLPRLSRSSTLLADLSFGLHTCINLGGGKGGVWARVVFLLFRRVTPR